MKVELRDIHKRFGSVHANDGVSLCIEPGTIYGLLGENGAGKSTLMKILSGFISADSGEILLDGKRVRISSPAEAIKLGVGMLHQDPLDFPPLRVLDDFVLGSPGSWLLSRRRARRELQELASQFHFNLDPEATVSSLSIGERQQLEIVRLLWLGAKVLILDEPTTAISAQQRAKLFAALRKLAKQGQTIIFVSHKLEEVEQICSEVLVLARGRVTGQVAMPFPTEGLVRMMFGQPVMLGKRLDVPLGRPLLELEDVGVSPPQAGRLAVKNLSLAVREGEVIGLAGLEGSGQRLLLEVSAGLIRPTTGKVLLGGRDMTGRPYREFLEAGVAHLPAGRLEEGLIAGMTLTEHVALVERRQLFLVNWEVAAQAAVSRIQEFNIKGRPTTRVEELSGGNQQRALLGLLPPQLKLLLMEHPTRGLDIESSEYIWGLLLNRTLLGTAIIFSSSDLDELLDRSDRILVFFNGSLVSALDARQATVEQLGELIGGKGVA
jgi:simple sugar transport system ATP-binding protein